MAVSGSGRQQRNWLSRLPDDVRSIVEGVKKDWESGGFSASQCSLARTIKSALEARGLQSVSVGEIRKWLSNS